MSGVQGSQSWCFLYSKFPRERALTIQDFPPSPPLSFPFFSFPLFPPHLLVSFPLLCPLPSLSGFLNTCLWEHAASPRPICYHYFRLVGRGPSPSPLTSSGTVLNPTDHRSQSAERECPLEMRVHCTSHPQPSPRSFPEKGIHDGPVFFISQELLLSGSVPPNSSSIKIFIMPSI